MRDSGNRHGLGPKQVRQLCRTSSLDTDTDYSLPGAFSIGLAWGVSNGASWLHRQEARTTAWCGLWNSPGCELDHAETSRAWPESLTEVLARDTETR